MGTEHGTLPQENWHAPGVSRTYNTLRGTRVCSVCRPVQLSHNCRDTGEITKESSANCTLFDCISGLQLDSFTALIEAPLRIN